MIIYEFTEKGKEKKVFYQRNIDHFKAFELFANNSRPIKNKDAKEFKIGSLTGKLTNECLFLFFTIGHNTICGDDNGKIFARLREYCRISKYKKDDIGKITISTTTLDKFEKGEPISPKTIKKAYESLIYYYVEKPTRRIFSPFEEAMFMGNGKIISKKEILSNSSIDDYMQSKCVALKSIPKSDVQNMLYKRIANILQSTDNVEYLLSIARALDSIHCIYDLNIDATINTLDTIALYFPEMLAKELTKINKDKKIS